MNRLFVLICGALLLPSVAFGAIGTQAQVSMHDFNFSPRTLTIEAGTTVFWSNLDLLPQSVTADDGSFASGDMGKGYSFSHTFDTAGTYPYFSRFSGNKGGIGMSGTIIVVESKTSPKPKPYIPNPVTLAPITPSRPLPPTYGTGPVYTPTDLWSTPIGGNVWDPRMMASPIPSFGWQNLLLRPRCFVGPYGHQCF